MIQTTIHLYQFHELSEKAQQKAIFEHREFLLSTMHPNDFISGCPEYDTPEQLQKAYNAEFEYYAMNDEPITDSITANEYYFFFDGTMAHTTHYTRGPRAGKIYVEIHGETDVITPGEVTT